MMEILEFLEQKANIHLVSQENRVNQVNLLKAGSLVLVGKDHHTKVRQESLVFLEEERTLVLLEQREQREQREYQGKAALVATVEMQVLMVAKVETAKVGS